MIIAANPQALVAETAYAQQASALAVATQELATGSALTTPATDPAAATITTLMAGELGALTQDQANIAQGIALLNTAAGGLAQAVTIAQQLETLSIQASNGTNTPMDAADLQNQVNALVGQLAQLGTATMYNGIGVLQGTPGPVVGVPSLITSGLSNLGGVNAGLYSVTLSMYSGSFALDVVNQFGQTVYTAITANPEDPLAGATYYAAASTTSGVLMPGWSEQAANPSLIMWSPPNASNFVSPYWGFINNEEDNGAYPFVGVFPGSGASASGTVTYTFTLTSTQEVYWATPEGGWTAQTAQGMPNGTTAVLLNGVTVTTLYQPQSHAVTVGANDIFWQDTLGPGTYSLSFRTAAGDSVIDGTNIYGVYIGAPVSAVTVTFNDAGALDGWTAAQTLAFNPNVLSASLGDSVSFLVQGGVAGSGAGGGLDPGGLGPDGAFGLGVGAGLVIQTGPVNGTPDQLGLILPDLPAWTTALGSLSVLTPAGAQITTGHIQSFLQTLTQGQATLGAQLLALHARSDAVTAEIQGLTQSRATLDGANMAAVSRRLAARQVLAHDGLGAVATADRLPQLLVHLLHV